jgi:hypothetical protein
VKNSEPAQSAECLKKHPLKKAKLRLDPEVFCQRSYFCSEKKIENLAETLYSSILFFQLLIVIIYSKKNLDWLASGWLVFYLAENLFFLLNYIISHVVDMEVDTAAEWQCFSVHPINVKHHTRSGTRQTRFALESSYIRTEIIHTDYIFSCDIYYKLIDDLKLKHRKTLS